ncbi:DEAD/DEAH box helicase family protein, partial [Candidatus Woesearchaeota archaeon]|nr:DEAD/DEAH box helicase family protein [Candidatus Woesearchaeota archaeon]
MDLLFPHEKLRESQEELIQDVRYVIKANKNLIVHAPTGLGKTAAVLAPALTEALE